ncbi:DUF5979 domain-containing protein [Candidatus Thiothrix anitrata]|uniref:DUF11 domain-containing protein n=1 Tax=Candidatus Thiothrix anitrata TaxID=2823902 RepID=A0ABX7X5T4_9GAMM|nr:DUF5979 domain-containing protein [Candidatus Thiothrix anitrata]QTR49968.1 DUF11 domain-containing protein [Candidatus Thiothrix anitrata]
MTGIKKLLGTIRHSVAIVTGMLCVIAAQHASAESYTPPAGVPAPSYADNFVVVGNPGNAGDSTGYGGVPYSYMVSATQITVQDWVDFLNDIGATGSNDLGLGPMTTSHPDCDNPWCYSPFAYSGSSWQVTSFNQNGMSLSASDAAKLPVDWRSLNNVARYLNWMATGSIDSGAFTFTNDGGPKGNWPIASFNGAYPGPRLPLEDELYKAMYRRAGTTNTYYTYPLGSGTPALATSSVNTGLHDSNVGGALTGVFSNGGGLYAQVGQETGNPWGIYDFGGNRHETTLNPGATGTTILRGASAFGNLSDSSKNTRQTLDAGRRYLSVGYRVWMGVAQLSARISITKQVTGGSDATRNFTINLNCAGTLYDKTFTLKHGQTAVSDFMPQGTTCTVTETPPSGAPSGYTYGTAIISPANITVPGDGSTVAVTVTNPLQAACSINSFTIAPVCNNNGTTGSATDDYRTFALNLTGTGVAATYNVSVNNGGIVTPTSGSYGTATNFRLQNGSAGNGTVYTLTATDATNSSCTRTATISDTGSCSPTGTLRVRKTVTNPPAGFSSPNFNIAVDCSDDAFDQNFTLAHGATRDITNIPVGTTCSVTETTPLPTAPAGYEYGTPAIAPSGAQTIVANTTIEVVVTNPLNSVSCPTINVTPNPLPNGTVGVAYNASPSANASSGGPYTYTWSAAGLPTGMSVNAGTGAVSGTPSATGNATVTASTTVAGQTCSGSTPLSVAAAPTGSLSVTKAVTGKPVGFTSPNFSVVVDCSVDSFDQTLTVADGATATINSIPTGTTCTVTEPTVPAAPAGYDYGTPVITPSGAQTIGNGTTIAVTVTNPLTLKLGSLQLGKSVSGQPAGFTSPDYTLRVDCSDDSFDQDVLIKAAENKTISNIPHGTTCTVTEPTQPTPPAGYSYGTAVITPASVTIAGDSTVSVSVLNPLEGDCAINTPVVTTQCYSNGTSSAADDTFGFRINTSGVFVAPTYDIQAGTLAVQDVPYGVESGTYGNFLISGGAVTATLADSNKASCQLNNVALTPPASCSAPPPSCVTVINKANVSAQSSTDQNPGNNEDGAALGANCSTSPQVDLELVKTASMTTVKRGDTLVYTLTLVNKGPDDASNVQVQDQLPAGLTYVSSQAERGSYDAASGIWTVGKVANGVPVKLMITVRAD